MHGFISELPILLDPEFDDDGYPIEPDPDLVLPFPSSHGGTSDVLDGDELLCFEHLVDPLERDNT